MSGGTFFATDEEMISATAHMHAMKNKIGGLLEKQTKARLVKEGIICESSEEEKNLESIESIKSKEDEHGLTEPIKNEMEPAMSMEKREEVEQDTLESQDIEDIFEFLLPPGTIPKSVLLSGSCTTRRLWTAGSGNLQHVAVLPR